MIFETELLSRCNDYAAGCIAEESFDSWWGERDLLFFEKSKPTGALFIAYRCSCSGELSGGVA
jgi:hypothetical protein